MKERITKARETIDRLSLRERLFLFAAGLVVLGGVWEAALAGPLDARRIQATQKMELLKTRLQTLDTALNSTVSGMSPASATPALAHASVAIAAGPPALVMMTRPEPPGTGWWANASAMPKSRPANTFDVAAQPPKYAAREAESAPSMPCALRARAGCRAWQHRSCGRNPPHA